MVIVSVAVLLVRRRCAVVFVDVEATGRRDRSTLRVKKNPKVLLFWAL